MTPNQSKNQKSKSSNYFQTKLQRFLCKLLQRMTWIFYYACMYSTLKFSLAVLIPVGRSVEQLAPIKFILKMSIVINMERLFEMWNGKVQNSGCRWIQFDKYDKFIYGVVGSGNKLQLVAQSIFGGDAVVLQEADCRIRYNSRFTAALGDEVVAVVIEGFFEFYLFSLANKPVEKYEVVQSKLFNSGAFGRGVLIDRGLFYSSHIGFFTMIFCEQAGEFMYRFVFNDAKKTCEAELITKYPDLAYRPIRRFSGNDKVFCVFKEGGDILYVYDFQEKGWSKKVLRNAPLFLTIGGTMRFGKSMKGVITSKEGESVAIFFKRIFMVLKLVGDSWEACPLVDSEKFPGHSFSSRALCTGGGVYIDGGRKTVMIFQQNISLRDIAVKKIISFWNPNMPSSFQSFMAALNLPTLTKRVYFGLTD